MNSDRSFVFSSLQPEAHANPAEALRSLDLPATEPAWAVSEEGFAPAREGEIESRMTVSNGYVGTRGSLPERTSVSAPVTYLAGVYESQADTTSVELVTLPDWTQLRIVVEGEPVSLEQGELLAHRRTLDLRHGMWRRTWRHRDSVGRVTTLECVRLASLADRHLLLQSVSILPENYAGTIVLESAQGMPQGKTQWRMERIGDATVFRGATMRGVDVAMGCAGEMRAAVGRIVEGAIDLRTEGTTERWTWRAERGVVARFDRFAVVHTSRETRDPAGAATRRLREVQEGGAEMHIRRHALAWEDRWGTADLRVVGDEAAQSAIRFAVYHLIAVANQDDERVSIGARGLSGPVYKGHVFWDTEIYTLPFYVFTHPAAARSLLMYRYHTLPAARARARALGYEGALYAWESADTGEDVTPDHVPGPNGRMMRVLTGLQEHHISADVAHAVWQYWRATGDETFFVAAGAAILMETARLWASRGRIESDGRYHIRTVIGPDEHHESVDDNAFTNVMAKWNLERAAEAADWLRAERPDAWRTIAEGLAIRTDEPAMWRHVASLMTTGFDPRTNLFEQFAGFFRLEELDWEAYRDRTRPLDFVLGRERTQRTKIVKQADVVALSALLWEQYPEAVHEANFRYYEPLTVHGSSLSPAFHALVSARLGDTELAAQFFRDAAAIDLANGAGNGAGGVHIAALGGLWQAAVFGFAGVRLREDGLVLDPHLPPTWDECEFSLQWRGRKLAVSIRRKPGRVAVELASGAPMVVELGKGIMAEVAPQRRYVAHRDATGWGLWQDAI